MILALEFSSDQRGVALVLEEPGPPDPLAAAIGDYNQAALDLIAQVLDAAAREREAITTIAVGLGPGSYTGIRNAIALAQAWQLARGVSLLGLSSLDVLAADARERGWIGRVHFIVDAQRNEFYHATYEMGDAEPRRVTPLRLVTRAEAVAAVGPDDIVAGPDADGVFPRGRRLHPSAASLGLLARGRSDFIAGADLIPVYLRPLTFVKAPPTRTDLGA